MTQKLQDLENKWKRAVADYRNLEKRTEAQKHEFVKLATGDFVTKLLPILDDLDRAASHLKDSGLNLILAHFKNVLQEEGVTEIAALGHPFTHTTMEATDTVPGKKDTVISVVATGYKLHDKILRPARVTVGKGS